MAAAFPDTAHTALRVIDEPGCSAFHCVDLQQVLQQAAIEIAFAEGDR